MKEKNINKNMINNKNGITLIALVITIIVMLILVMVTINISLNGGLFSYAGKSALDTQKAQEIEIVTTSSSEAWLDSNVDKLLEENSNEITKENLEKAVKGNAKGRDVEILPDEDGLVVHFKDVGRMYAVDSESDVYEIIKDETPGVLSGSGTEKDPFKIQSIEDLVALSIMVNGGNEELDLEENSFEGQYVTLERTLDFKSKYSYNDANTTRYNTYLKGDETTPLITQLNDTRKWICTNWECIDENFQGKFPRKQ